jgi:Flp pilus assembly pilin Flp
VLETDVNTLLSLAVRLWDDRSGATAIEYSLLAALIPEPQWFAQY